MISGWEGEEECNARIQYGLGDERLRNNPKSLAESSIFPRGELPESMAISGILEHKLLNIILHRWRSIQSEIDKRRDTPVVIL